MANPDLFDVYFRRADTDHDGRISGLEAVSFFQGANLNREVLAKIWQYADQGQTGYLSRPQFHNALKLVTVAQTGRELTPAIVSRALTGPAASQIPAPQIQFPSGLSTAAPHAQPLQGVRPGPMPAVPQAQPPGGIQPVRPMGPSMPSYQQYIPANLPPQPRPMATTSLPKPSNAAAPVMPPSISGDWPTSKSSSWPGPAANNILNGQISQAQASALSQDGLQGSFLGGTNITSSKSLSSTEPALFGGEIFTAVPVKPPGVSSQVPSKVGEPQMPQPIPTSRQGLQPEGMQTAVQPNFASNSLVPSMFTPSASSKMLQPVSSPAGEHDRGFGSPAPVTDATKTWPKMTGLMVRRYTKIFFEVDTDKDGKINGNEARDLFLSWHLPREVLKQVWDLSDQDHDSMLSLREFCVALFLMERHREGQTLPRALPAIFNFDESGVQALRMAEAQVAVAQNSAGYKVPAWQQNPSVPAGPGLPPRPFPGSSPVRAPMPAMGQGGFVPAQMVQPRSKAPVMEVHVLEKQIMDSKEKMEFYRTKMQDIVLFKTRCENRLAEISDKAAADKREVESLAKRYDEKYKQAAESQSRLLSDEAVFRDVQDRRLELQSALVRMEQGGDLNAFLQARADRLHDDLEELKKALNMKHKKIGLPVKPISLLELPFGWQPGIQEGAAQWDEDWDKFEGEGFTSVQDYMEEGTAGSDSSKPKSIAGWDESGQVEDGHDLPTTDAELHAEEAVSGGNQNMDKDCQDNTAAHDNHEDSSASDLIHSGPVSSSKKSTKDSQRLDQNPSSLETQFDDFASNGGDWDTFFSHKKDETESNASWGRSDAVSTASEDSNFRAGQLSSASSFARHDPSDTLSSSGHVKDDLPSFGPIRTKERTSVFFDNSVPSTPLNNNYSPGRISGGGFFDNPVSSTLLQSNFSPRRLSSGGFFDSSIPSTPLNSSHSPAPISSGSFFDDSAPSTPLYGSHTTGSGPNRELFGRFDSFSSTSSDFPRTLDSFGRFDSFNHTGSGSSQGFASFDEQNPLGSGTFGGNQPSKRSTDAWSAFG